MSKFHTDRKLFAVLCVAVAVGFASTSDALMKSVSGVYPVHQALFIRSLAALPVLTFLVFRLSGLQALLTPYWPRILLRGSIMCSAFLAFILSIAAVPIANSVAIYFTMPLFAAALSRPFLGERVPLHRWIAIVVGLCGVLIANPPDGDLFHPAALLALWSAAGYAIGQLIGRGISLHVPPAVLSFHQNLVYFGVSCLLAILFGNLDLGDQGDKSLAFLTRHWQAPTLWHMSILCMLGVFVAFGMLLFSTAYKHAAASYVAPFEYSTIFWAVAYGYLFWGDIPQPRMLLGAAVVMAAGLFMVWRDHTARRMMEAA